MLQILATMTGLALSGIGVLMSRWLRKATLTERIERRLKLVALYQRMKAAGLDAAGLERMEQELHGEESARKLSQRLPR